MSVAASDELGQLRQRTWGIHAGIIPVAGISTSLLNFCPPPVVADFVAHEAVIADHFPGVLEMYRSA